MNRATEMINSDFEKVAKFGKAKSTAVELYRHTAKQRRKINPKTLKSVAIGAGGVAGVSAADKAIQKYDNERLKDDTKVRFRRDVLVPGAKRTAKQVAIGAAPIAGAVLGATYLKHSPKKAGHVFSDMAQAKKYTQGQRVLSPEQARKLLKQSVVAGGAGYVGSKYYLRDKALRDRAKVTGQEVTPADRAINALIPVARKKMPATAKAFGLGTALEFATPEAQLQMKRHRQERKKKIDKKAFYIVDDSFEKIAASVKDVKKSTELENMVPNPTGLVNKLQQPENYKFKSKVNTFITPTAYGKNDDIGYQISTFGIGRRSDIIETATNLKDVVRASKQQEEVTEYDNRVMDSKQALRDAYNRPVGVKDVLSLGIARAIEKKKAKNGLLNSLTPEERDLLIQTREEYAEQFTQDPLSAEMVKRTNYHYY